MDTLALARRLDVEVVSSLHALKTHWINEGEIDLARQVEKEIKWVESAAKALKLSVAISQTTS